MINKNQSTVMSKEPRKQRLNKEAKEMKQRAQRKKTLQVITQILLKKQTTPTKTSIEQRSSI